MIDPIAFVKKHEGVRYKMYKDTLGIPTIGIGFNLTRPDADKALKLVGANRKELLSGGELSAVQVDALLRRDVDECIDDLTRMFVGFDKMPDNVRLVLIDMRFNLGPVRLRGFTNTLESFRRGDYRDVAKRLRMSLWAKQVGSRAVENIALIEAEVK